MQVLSKLTSVPITCKEYVHPWTDSCGIASAEFLIVAVQDSFRIYSAVYMLSLAMRGRIPSLGELKRTIRGLIQSTAFLTMSAFSYSVFLCALRRLFGSYNFYTASYIPAYLAAFCSILVERPSRRGLLCLYVSNVATETGWNMLKARGLARSIPYGEILIFGLSTSILLYYYRLNRQKDYKDSMFDVFRFALGDSEVMKQRDEIGDTRRESRVRERSRGHGAHYYFIQRIVRAYLNVISKIKALKQHNLCRHKHSCIYNTLTGGARMFSIGLGIQVIMKVLFQARRMIRRPALLKRAFLSKEILKLGMFLGGFTSLYKLSSCLLRHITNSDKAVYAIPSGLIASIAFGYYADTTIALYIMWKMLQMTYNWGIEKGYVPKIPGFTVLLYCASTALLFHAATLEPMSLRPSYWKFLYSISGGRIMVMDRNGFDVYGLGTSGQILETGKLCNTPPVLKFQI
ncbi:transmembrane protein 135-like [Wyeomyia smithii]|uniref:transmembrane protein 135-like n=1 Tax=Wyeomyia smithii TaxID=174621 RepID=UPI002467EB46|nr:transmembrane protein 135-like [Wyeomyia smithii]XP_055533165.1 transmembrane protein 135-like [Wyeomyia smithii]XP_055533166.1 transmembrane protein 135-like [Wyeomyia smithii]XP_055533167.1 transmembrane protein 135-like [Wyeomyia smithii]XP_055533168.1 transmembrane protein 135-like [Wyeomyia smithii]